MKDWRAHVLPDAVAQLKKLISLLLIALAVSATAQEIVYDNTVTAEAFYKASSSATVYGAVWRSECLLDDLTMTHGGQVSVVGWRVIQQQAPGHHNVSMHLCFYLQDGANGGPGTFLGAHHTAMADVPYGTNKLYTADLTSDNLFLPTGNIWMGVYFECPNTETLMSAKANGILLMDPPVVGSTQNFNGRAVSTQNFLASNPTTTFETDGGTTFKNNLGFSVQVVPEPASMLALGLGLATLARRRRVNR